MFPRLRRCWEVWAASERIPAPWDLWVSDPLLQSKLASGEAAMPRPDESSAAPTAGSSQQTAESEPAEHERQLLLLMLWTIWLREWGRISGVTWGWSCDPWSSSGYHWGCRSRMCFGGRHDEAPLTFSHLTRWPESRWTIFILSDVHSGDKIERSNINAINVIAGT